MVRIGSDKSSSLTDGTINHTVLRFAENQRQSGGREGLHLLLKVYIYMTLAASRALVGIPYLTA